jgi:histidinol-phosphate aminotransferase
MGKIDRRDWLKTSSLGTLSVVFGGLGISSAADASSSKYLNTYVKSPIVRLSSNENPYGPSDAVKKAIADSFDKLCRYPWQYHKALLEKLAEKHGVSTDHIVLCAGSNEGLYTAGLVYGGPESEMISMTPTYLAMLDYTKQFGTFIHEVPLDQSMLPDLESIKKRITKRTSLVFLCNPNNPTGTLLPAIRFRRFCEEVSEQAILFSDEAYFDYIEDPNYPSMIELVKEDKNVIVSRTFSKIYGLAGLRIGYLVTRPDIAARLRKATMASVNVLGTFAALNAMEDQDFYQFSLKRNKESQMFLYKLYDEYSIRYLPSNANFVFADTQIELPKLQKFMESRGIIIGRAFPPYTTWSRVSTGTMEDMEAYAKVFREAMNTLR